MITKKNYVAEAKKIDFSKLSKDLQEGHDLTNDFIDLYDDMDKETQRIIDIYIESLNKTLAKKPNDGYEAELKRQREQGLVGKKNEGISLLGMTKGKNAPVPKKSKFGVPIGTNSSGEKLLADKNGVRTKMVTANIGVTEPVGVIPGGGSKVPTAATREYDFKTKEELKSASKPKDKFDAGVAIYLHKKFPRKTDHLLIVDNDNKELSDDEYNDVFFELVDDLRKYFLEFKGDNDDLANSHVEDYMSNPKNASYYKDGKLVKKAQPSKAKTQRKIVAKFKKGDLVDVTGGILKGSKGLVISRDTNGVCHVQVDGKMKGIPEKDLRFQSKPSKSTVDDALAAMLKKTANEKDIQNWSAKQVLDRARQFQSVRSERSTRDEKTTSKKRLSPNGANLLRWMNAPGSFDLIGIDSYKSDDPTANLKLKKQVWFAKYGLKYKG